MHKLTIEEFIARAKAVHGERYDYSSVEYSRWDVPITIICKQHGPFLQTPNTHTSSKGCPLCGIAQRTMARKNRTTIESFTTVSHQVHNHKYTYRLFEGFRMKDIINIICPIHGHFTQIADKHVQGHGCPMCAQQERRKKRTKTQLEFIEECQQIHKTKYDYGPTIYTGIYGKILIICPQHGVWTTVARNHLTGHGCPRCNSSHGEELIRQWLQNKSILYTEQQRFHDCLYIKKLAFDFYIPILNIFIEYQGIQHYAFRPHLHRNMHNFETCLKRDRIKKEYAQSHGIFLEIKYDENVEEVLDTFFKLHHIV